MPHIKEIATQEIDFIIALTFQITFWAMQLSSLSTCIP